MNIEWEFSETYTHTNRINENASMHHKNAIKMSYQKHKSHYVHMIKLFSVQSETIFELFRIETNNVHRTYTESLYVELQAHKIFLYHENGFMSKQKIYFFIYEFCAEQKKKEKRAPTIKIK